MSFLFRLNLNNFESLNHLCMKTYFSTFFLIIKCVCLNCQVVEPSTSVEKQTLQIELESQYAIQKENITTIKAWSIPSALFRYGLFDGFELDLNAPLIKEELYENDHLIHSLNKFDDLQFGFSINLWQQKKILPETAFMARAIVPFQSELDFNQLGSVLALNMSNSISNQLSLNYNIGYVHETDDTNAGYYILNLTYDLNSRVHFFIENLADFNCELLFSQNINTGAGYNFKDNITLDFSIANGLNHNLFYTGIIFTWALNTTNI